MDTFYGEENEENNIKMLKNKMTLDFSAPASHNKKAKLIKTCILESPDLKMLKFTSPELERMIIQGNGNGLVTTTPTPSAALPYFLKQEQEATEEQEQFSRGFVDALYQLHQTNGQQQQPPQHHPTNCLSQNINYNSNINNNNNQNNSHSNSNTNNNNHNSINNTSSDSSSDLTIADNNSHNNTNNNNNNRRNSYHMLVPSTVSTTSATMQTSTSSVTTTGAKFAVPQVPSSHVQPPTTTAAAATVTQPEQYVSVSSCQTNGSHVLINQTVNNHNSVLPPYSQAVNNHNNSIYPMSIKIEPQQQKVNYSSMKELSPTSAQTSLAQPIDMEDQERIKLERKRLRNRIAASKCRRRKLERISKLEDKVKALKGENSELSIVVNKLRDQVCSLKQQVMEHVKCGCQLMKTQ